MSNEQTIAGRTAKELRDTLGLSKGYVSDLVSGKRRPSLDLAFRMERELGIPLSTWAPDEDQAAPQDAAA